MTRIQLPQAYLDEVFGTEPMAQRRPRRSHQVPLADLWDGLRRIAATRPTATRG